MKRVFVTILSFLYLAVASGITVSVHYCMGDLASVEYGIPSDDECGKCGMKERKGCCHTESKLVKIQDEHQWVKDYNSFKQIPAEPIHFNESAVSFSSLSDQLERSYHSPPDPRVNEVYLHNCVFRI